MFQVSFGSKAPHATLFVELSYQETEAPTALIEDFQAQGWKLNPAPPATHLGVLEQTLTKSGSGLFGGWTAEEKPKFTSEARSILKKHGATGVPHNKLGYRDLS